MVCACAALGVAFAGRAAADDVSGKWKVTSKSPRGERVYDITLAQSGEKVTVPSRSFDVTFVSVTRTAAVCGGAGLDTADRVGTITVGSTRMSSFRVSQSRPAGQSGEAPRDFSSAEIAATLEAASARMGARERTSRIG